MRKETEDLQHVLILEMLEYYRRANEKRRRERQEERMNESLRRRGYPRLYQGSKRRRGR
jgi:hypothetical protein